jgi:hypothetical protein
VNINGEKVPAIRVRQVDAPIELEFGQTGVLTGLVQQRTEAIQNEAGITENNQEIVLLFLVTPESVDSLTKKASVAAAKEASLRTATTDSEDAPRERSLRVIPPYTPR